MCGIAGVIGEAARSDALLHAMGGRLAHRGPDDAGIWSDGEAGVALVHRRLAILDLSPHGHQPMASQDGRWMVVYNGEIYNHLALRSELEAVDAAPAGGWRGHSDTETLLAAISRWGLEPAVQRCVGMFAIAAWDRKDRQLNLVRDRFGEKPLYHGWVGTDFVFASELKAIAEHPSFTREIDREALGQYMARGWVPEPLSIYRGISKLTPGSILTVTPATVPGASLSSRAYWSYRETVLRGLERPIADEQDALAELEQVLGEAVRGQSIADVPVGAFLSGGIDSSTIVALYQKHASTPVRTYSIGFAEKDFNEADDARRVAEHLGTVHHEALIGPAEAQAVIPQLPHMYDEPFGDSSQIPTFLVSRFARKEVTVALTGDGGDELFGGYNRHVHGPRLWRKIARVPRPLRAAIRPLAAIPARRWEGLVPGPRAQGGAKIARALQVASRAGSLEDVYQGFLDQWAFEPSPVLGGEGAGHFDLLTGDTAHATRLMFADAVGYLPGDILHKVDRAAMAVSLETRVPFLDHRVAEVAARVPLAMKVRGGTGKWIVRQLLGRHLPPSLFERPKSGFAVPVGEWIKGQLRPWAEELLDASRMAGEGYLDPAVVGRRWSDHLSGRRDSTAAVWAVLMFQAWLRSDR